MKTITLKQFSELCERLTGFEMMDRNGQTLSEYIDHNIAWFRSWAEEMAQKLEDQPVRGYKP